MRLTRGLRVDTITHCGGRVKPRALVGDPDSIELEGRCLRDERAKYPRDLKKSYNQINPDAALVACLGPGLVLQAGATSSH